jgi:hypothetical protein
MQAEFESLEDNNTWTLVREPKDRKVSPGDGYTKSSMEQMVKLISAKLDT